MDEQQWIRRVLKRFTAAPSAEFLGPGDDAALLALTPGSVAVLTVDSMVEGIHFRHEWLNDRDLAIRLLRIGLSDIAAMGATPMGVLLAIKTPELPGRVGARFWDGVEETLKTYRCSLLGGDLTRTPGVLSFSCTVMGQVPMGQEVRRMGARPGDGIWVTGSPGSARAARKKLEAGDLDRDSTVAWRRPDPPVAAAGYLAAQGWMRAAIDVSDGLGIDLTRVLHTSSVGADLNLLPLVDAERDIGPEEILEGGEDYELLFTSSPDHQADVERVQESHGVQLTRIGEITAGNTLEVRVGHKLFPYTPKGWDPFSEGAE